MGAENETLGEVYANHVAVGFTVMEPSRGALEWVMTDITENSPWFYWAEWFDRIVAEGYLTYRRVERGEVLPHRSGTRTCNGDEVVAMMTDKGREWYRAHLVAEKLRRAT